MKTQRFVSVLFALVLLFAVFSACSGKSGHSSSSSSTKYSAKLVMAIEQQLNSQDMTLVRINNASKMGGEAVDGTQAWSINVTVITAAGQEVTLNSGVVVK